MGAGQTPPETPPELRLLWPTIDDCPPDQSIDHETTAIAERRHKCFRGFTQGMTLREIAEVAKCSKSTVANDIRYVLDSWVRSAKQEAAAHVAGQLARLLHIETEMFDAWERSKKDAQETDFEETDGATKSAKLREKRKSRDGNAEYMRIALECVRERSRLLGLIATGEPPKDAGAGGKEGRKRGVVVIELGPKKVGPKAE